MPCRRLQRARNLPFIKSSVVVVTNLPANCLSVNVDTWSGEGSNNDPQSGWGTGYTNQGARSAQPFALLPRSGGAPHTHTRSGKSSQAKQV